VVPSSNFRLQRKGIMSGKEGGGSDQREAPFLKKTSLLPRGTKKRTQRGRKKGCGEKPALMQTDAAATKTTSGKGGKREGDAKGGGTAGKKSAA